MTYKPKKMTYPMYMLIKKMGKDLGGIVLDMMWMCDSCADLQIGLALTCNTCSQSQDLCRQCWDLKGFTCWHMPCLRCSVCGHHHCLNHQIYPWSDGDVSMS